LRNNDATAACGPRVGLPEHKGCPLHARSLESEPAAVSKRRFAPARTSKDKIACAWRRPPFPAERR